MRMLLAAMTIATGMAFAACGGGDAVDRNATRITIAGRQEAFDQTVLRAPAGPVAITFRNEESILHNIRLFEGDDANGRLVKQTPIKRGPRDDTLNVTLASGSYFFDCEIHPQSMRGTLRVS